MTTDAADDDDPAAKFETIYVAECSAIRARRLRSGKPSDPTQPLTDLRGLALSGGGIRSATFCLGVLQQLADAGRIKCFDYLSTVSGGGFIGGWWSAWLSRSDRRDAAGEAAGIPAVFPDQEGIELNRQETGARYVPEGSRSAGVDPIHHVRLFSNYLTPRKGALSGDTWRAITVVSRNLLITLLTLLPMLGAAVFAAQIYFVADKNLAAAFVCGQDSGTPSTAIQAPADRSPGCVRFGQSLDQRLQVRAARALVPIVSLAAWVALLILYWIVIGTGSVLLGILAILSAGGVAWMLIIAKRDLIHGSGIVAEMLKDAWFLPLMLGGLAVVTGLTLWAVLRSRSAASEGGPATRGEVLTNRVTKLQTAVLTGLAVVAVVLFFGGFSHELIHFFVAKGSEGLSAWARKVGGAGGIAVALGGAIFTAFKAAPTGGSDAATSRPARLTSLVFAISPPLLMVLLIMVLATGSRALLAGLPGPEEGVVSNLHRALLVAMAVCALFACFEYFSDEGPLLRRIVVLVVAVLVGVIASKLPIFSSRVVATAVTGLLVAVASLPWLWIKLRPRLERGILAQNRTLSRRAIGWLTIAIVVILALLLTAAGGALGMTSKALGQGPEPMIRATFGGMTFSAAFLALLLVASSRLNTRTMSLLSLVFVLLATLYGEQFLKQTEPQVFYPQAILALIGVALAFVVGLGWLTDPNYLSLHGFYRARLVRAYLGASNEARYNAEITESVDGDDLDLSELGTDIGPKTRPAPYHLVNTTLNLVAGRDLATAQRSADGFILSPLYCGSLRTGYRPTTGYMGGRLTLGTALAVSGAAASPNMGSKTGSAALAMLMTLFNVRLGYWAPNPAKQHWKIPRPRLWPFYVLREFLSQTNDLSSYCYLTDGGHFDNTGLYSLVQRGCRSIFLVDCGADPRPCFADLGDAIRRCRIDFRADIQLSVNQFMRSPGAPTSGVHYVVGHVVYDREHARLLGWGDLSDPDDRSGTIVWVKPSVMGLDPADVRQYSLENDVFPQQTTGDQWFDEAQFESYRRLGMECARAALSDSEVAAAFPVG